MATVVIWGKDGIGKSTLASNLGCLLAKDNKLTGILDCKTTFGSIQHYFGMQIPEEKSIKNALICTSDDEIKNYFVQHDKLKNLLMMGLCTKDNCLSLMINETDTNISRISNTEEYKRYNRLVLNTKNKFDYYIMDCGQSIKEPLTLLGFTYSDIFIEVVQTNIQGIAFMKSHSNTLKNSINCRHIRVAIEDNSDLNAAKIESELGIKFDVVVPYTSIIEKSKNKGVPVALGGPNNYRETKYLKAIKNIVSQFEKEKVTSETSKKLFGFITVSK